MAEREKSIKKKSRRQRVIPVLPSLFTTGNLFFGLLSIITSIQILAFSEFPDASSVWVYRKFWWASAFIGIAALLDTLDGLMARVLKSESNFGISYDSLADSISFGVAPGVLIYVWALMGSGKLGLMATLFYIVCTVLRLARFNVQSKTVEKSSFTGLPSPAAAGVMFSPVLLLSELNASPDEWVMWFYLIAAPFIGLLMVSDIPYWKTRIFIRWRNPFNALVIAAIVIAAIITNPEVIVFLLAYTYCLAGVVFYVKRQLKEKPKESKESEEEEIKESR